MEPDVKPVKSVRQPHTETAKWLTHAAAHLSVKAERILEARQLRQNAFWRRDLCTVICMGFSLCLCLSLRVYNLFLRVSVFSVRVAPIRGALSHGDHGNCAYLISSLF